MPTTGEVEYLDATATGRWAILSRSGTTHILDLDASTYERRSAPGSERFAYDNTVVHLTRIEVWPRVGSRMLIWFDDPETPDLLEHFRMCATIRRITAAIREEPPC